MSNIEPRSISVSWEPVETVITDPPSDPAKTADVSYEATVALKRANQDVGTYRGKDCHFR